MKTRKLFLSCIICCLFLQANAQTENTIVNDNSSWATLSYGLGAFLIPYNVTTKYIYFEGDSIIGKHTYKKTFSHNDSLHENIEYEGLLREQDKKTYFIPFYSNREYLLYDFSLEEGMSFEYQEPTEPEYEPILFYAKKVDSIEINGKQKKRIQFTPHSFSDYIIVTWIENLGSVNGLFYPDPLPVGTVKALLCYFENNELVYKNPKYSECYYDKPEDVVSVPTVAKLHDINVYPNPTSGQLEITNCESRRVTDYIIYNTVGQIIIKGELQGDSTINIESLAKGMYVLKIYDTNKQVSIFKIIKE